MISSQPDESRAGTSFRPARAFFVANLELVDDFDAPLAALVTEWGTQANGEFAPVGAPAASAAVAPRSAGSFSDDEMSPTRVGALTLLLRFARELVTELSAFLARIDQEILLTQDSETISAARLRPDGSWEVSCAKCKRTVRFSKTAHDVACDGCKRTLIRDARSMQEGGERSKSSTIYCLSDLPLRFADRVGPDTFLLAFVERGTDEFSPVGAKPDASGKHPTIPARDLPGKRHPSRQSALASMRETVQARLASLFKQRARLAREIS